MCRSGEQRAACGRGVPLGGTSRRLRRPPRALRPRVGQGRRLEQPPRVVVLGVREHSRTRSTGSDGVHDGGMSSFVPNDGRGETRFRRPGFLRLNMVDPRVGEHASNELRVPRCVDVTVAQATTLGEQTGKLCSEPTIERLDVLGSRLPA